MKRTNFLLMTMIPAFALVSCGKETGGMGNEDMAGKPISVSISGGSAPTTRGAQVTTANITGDYKLWIFQKSGAVYSNVNTALSSTGVDVTVNTSGNTALSHYWPVPAPSSGLTYYAVHPTSAVVAETKPTLGNPPSMAVKYTVNNTMSSQTDLLIAYGEAASNPLPIHFQHALTRVTFQGQVTNNDINLSNIKITGIVIKNVRTTETLTFNSYTPFSSGAITTWVPAAATWSTTGTTTGTFTAANLTTNNTITTTAPTAGTYIGYAAASGSDSFFVMPMGSLTNVKLDVTVTWTGGTNTFTDIALPTTVSSWAIGQHVNYLLNFNANNQGTLLSVGAVTVQAWGSAANGGTVNIN